MTREVATNFYTPKVLTFQTGGGKGSASVSNFHMGSARMTALKPLPHPRPKLEPKRLPQVKAMTVAAGFLCSDGIILCADSEHSDEITKFQRSKVYRFGKNLVLTGAGQISYIRMAFDKLSDKYEQGIPDTPSGARLALEEVVVDVYANHIAPFFEVSNRPYLHLITGTRCASGAMALVKSEDTAFFLATGLRL